MSNTLFLRGVIQDDLQYLQQPKHTQMKVTGQKCSEICNIKNSYFPNMEELPMQFDDVICCWNCTLNIQLPVYVLQKKNDQIQIKAVFCSFVCGFQWIDQLKDKQKASKYYRLLQEYFIYKTGQTPKHINNTLQKYDLQKFGGVITNQALKQNIQILEMKLIKNNITRKF